MSGRPLLLCRSRLKAAEKPQKNSGKSSWREGTGQLQYIIIPVGNTIDTIPNLLTKSAKKPLRMERDRAGRKGFDKRKGGEL